MERTKQVSEQATHDIVFSSSFLSTCFMTTNGIDQYIYKETEKLGENKKPFKNTFSDNSQLCVPFSELKECLFQHQKQSKVMKEILYIRKCGCFYA